MCPKPSRLMGSSAGFGTVVNLPIFCPKSREKVLNAYAIWKDNRYVEGWKKISGIKIFLTRLGRLD